MVTCIFLPAFCLLRIKLEGILPKYKQQIRFCDSVVFKMLGLSNCFWTYLWNTQSKTNMTITFLQGEENTFLQLSAMVLFGKSMSTYMNMYNKTQTTLRFSGRKKYIALCWPQCTSCSELFITCQEHKVIEIQKTSRSHSKL